MTLILVGIKMIINNSLDFILKNRSNLKVLRVLNSLTVGISGRETGRLAKIGLRSAQIALEELEKTHIVKKQFGGRENLFSINRKNYLTINVIEKLFNEENKYKSTILKKIVSEIKELIDSLILFGSTARNEETIDSDLDICIVYSKNKREIVKRVNILRDNLSLEFGVLLAPFYISRKDFKAKALNDKSPITSIIKEGKLLSGVSISRLIND